MKIKTTPYSSTQEKIFSTTQQNKLSDMLIRGGGINKGHWQTRSSQNDVLMNFIGHRKPDYREIQDLSVLNFISEEEGYQHKETKCTK
jgi:hypothetical protein